MEQLKHAYSAFKADDEKLSKTIIGGILTVLSLLIIPAFFLQGYYVRILQNTETVTEQFIFPEWSDWGELFINGLLAMLLSIFLLLPAYVLVYGPQLAGMESAASLALVLIGNLLMLLISYFIPAIFALYFREGFSAITNLSRLTNITFSSEYFIAYLSVMVVSIVLWIASIFFIIFTIGFGLLALPFGYFAFQAIVMCTFGFAVTQADTQTTKPTM